VIYGSHQHNSEQWLSKFLQDLQNYAIYGLPQHNSERWLSKFLQDLHNNNNDLSDHKQLQTTPLGHRYQIIYQTQQQNTLDFIDLGVLVEIQ
jgi:hypothetical protein